MQKRCGSPAQILTVGRVVTHGLRHKKRPRRYTSCDGGTVKWERLGSAQRRNTEATKLCVAGNVSDRCPPEAILNLPLDTIGKATRLHPNASIYAPWVQDWLTVDRFKTYLRAAGNSTQRAFDLYQWNTAVNAALLHDFAHAEVALRNALHRELSTLVQPSLTWLAGPTAQTLFPVAMTTNASGTRYDANGWLRGKLQESRTKFNCGHVSTQLSAVATGRIVADLSFGVWVDLLHSRFEPTLWTNALRNAFVQGISRHDVHARLRTLNEVRNRLAHHEPNLANVNKAHRDLFWLLSVLDRDVQKHVRAHSKVAGLLGDKPR